MRVRSVYRAWMEYARYIMMNLGVLYVNRVPNFLQLFPFLAPAKYLERH